MTIGDFQRQTLAHVSYRQVGGTGHFPMLILPPPALGSDGAFHLYVDPVTGDDTTNDGLAPTQALKTIQALCDRICSYVAVGTDVDIVGEIANASYAEDVILALPNPPKKRVILRGDVASQTPVVAGTTTAGADASITDTTKLFGSSPLVNVTGVTIIDVATTGDGVGTLAFTAVGTLLQWTAPGSGTPGAAVNVGAGGTFRLNGGDGTFIRVTVVAVNLPVGNASDLVTITNFVGLTLHLFDPANRAATERWTSIRSFTNNLINPIQLASTGGGVVPGANWTYEVLMPAVRLTGDPAGNAVNAPMRVTMPWQAVDSEERSERSGQVIFAWLRFSNDDAAAPGSLESRGGLLRHVGCVYDGTTGGAYLNRGSFSHGLDSDASGDPVFGLVGANTSRLSGSRALYRLTSTVKYALNVVGGKCKVGFVVLGRGSIHATLQSYLELSSGFAVYRGGLSIEQSSTMMVLGGSAGLQNLFKGTDFTTFVGGGNATVFVSRNSMIQLRGQSRIDVVDTDGVAVLLLGSDGSCVIDSAAITPTRQRSLSVQVVDRGYANCQATFAGFVGSIVPELKADGSDLQGNTIAGVRLITYSVATPAGTGTLTYVAAARTLQWAAPTDGPGAAVPVGAGGMFTLLSANVAFTLDVFVFEDQLPAGNLAPAITVANQGLAVGTFAGLGAATAGGARTPLVGGNSGARINRRAA